ncbi:hypothetical protein ACQEVB_06985 [Pseudonocardia sp. CA-107938]|uniref:hypothetical protein n=1 Tax=Pseudonocardia sp. CA-107938 TaxID=3240021 RepID=UPI003D93F0A3
MKLHWLCKSELSRKEGQCPAMYLGENKKVMVGQGKLLDAETAAELRHVASDEGGLAFPTEMMLRAAALVLAEHGRPAMLAEVEAFLAEQAGGSA